jgi:alpha-tubulin suppressor-like RCC1 family protein
MTSVRSFPVLDDVGASDWQSVSVGDAHTCGLKSTGAAYCWGSNQYGQLGVTAVDTACGSAEARIPCALRPALAAPGLTFVSISAGSRFTCGITSTRAAYCWGANDENQLGDFSPGGATPVLIPSAFGWSQISAGFSHACAVRTDGALFCWGANDRGQLGTGRIAGNVAPIRVPMAATVAAVSAGQQRTCARTTAGQVFCWGSIWTARVDGVEMARVQSSPQAVPGAPAMSSLSVGTFTTCGADLSGVAYCWEANPRGEMGTGTDSGSTTPVRVATDVPLVQLSAGMVQTCGVGVSGIGYCWGDDSFGQLGVSPSTLAERCGSQQMVCATTPVAVFGRQQFTDISTGFGSHTCGVSTHGNLYCWGLGTSGQRGDGTDSFAIAIPILVQEPTTP